jgi:flagellar export protein FliJ
MTGRHDPDRALAAVRRVRASREQDSRLGLARALAERTRREEAVEVAADRLTAARSFGAGSVRDFLASTARGAALATNLADARRSAVRAGTIAAEAGHHWQQDRKAVRVVELLLERRAEQRRADQARAEARELDDIAGQTWLRFRSSPEVRR